VFLIGSYSVKSWNCFIICWHDYLIVELNLTAKDKHALKSLSVDLRDMLRMKKVDDRVESPEYRRVFMDGNYLDEMLNWIEDFRNRMADAESEQPNDELNLETKKLIDAGWITQPN